MTTRSILLLFLLLLLVSVVTCDAGELEEVEDVGPFDRSFLVNSLYEKEEGEEEEGEMWNPANSFSRYDREA